MFWITLIACNKKEQKAPVLLVNESGMVTWSENKTHSYYICIDDEYIETKDNKYQLNEYQNIKVKYLGNDRYLDSDWSNIVSFIELASFYCIFYNNLYYIFYYKYYF
mgnify:CR=1 FL=1